jgi:acetyltransferase
MVGVIRDPVFGPAISFGLGGTLVEIIKNHAIALPPLNEFIIKTLIGRTGIAKLLNKFRNMLPVNISLLEKVLLSVSEIVCELPQIQEMDINPLIANDQNVIALDARMMIADYSAATRYDHMAIHPYPHHLISTWQMADGICVTIRPIRPEDAQGEQTFVCKLSPQSRYFRFMQHLQELTPAMLVRLTQIDYDREMALVAIVKEEIVGIARYAILPDQQSCEFGLVVTDSWQNKGIGSHLMKCLFGIAKFKGLKSMQGEILTQNTNMLALVRHLGCTIRDTEDATIKLAIKSL